MEPDLHSICNAMMLAERKAAVLISHARHVLSETKSGHRDVVTAYDKEVQKLLMHDLSLAVPDAGFFCEELNTRCEPGKGKVFVIDPIDGTMNFVHGFHHSCISAALLIDGIPSVAVIYNPYVDEMFTAIRGEGAFLNRKPIHVSGAPLSESVVCIGTSPYYPDLTDRTFSLSRKLFDNSLDIRREGSAALDLCSVAAGRAGAYFELRLSLWDFAAGALLVREAGGECCRPDGNALPMTGELSGVAAGSPGALKELLSLAKDVL